MQLDRAVAILDDIVHQIENTPSAPFDLLKRWKSELNELRNELLAVVPVDRNKESEDLVCEIEGRLLHIYIALDLD